MCDNINAYRLDEDTHSSAIVLAYSQIPIFEHILFWQFPSNNSKQQIFRYFYVLNQYQWIKIRSMTVNHFFMIYKILSFFIRRKSFDYADEKYKFIRLVWSSDSVQTFCWCWFFFWIAHNLLLLDFVQIIIIYSLSLAARWVYKQLFWTMHGKHSILHSV